MDRDFPRYGVKKYMWMDNHKSGYHYEPFTHWFNDLQTATDVFNIIQLSQEIPQVSLLLFDGLEIKTIDVKEYAIES